MITRVKVKGYKSLKDIEVSLQPLTIIIGPNAAGKSNLFDLLKLVSRIVTSRTLKEAFEEHRGDPIEAFYCDSGIEDVMKKDIATFSVEIDVELSKDVVESIEKEIQKMREGLPKKDSKESDKRRITHKFLRYYLTIGIRPDSGHLQVREEKLVALREDGTERQRPEPFIEVVKDSIRLRMEGKSAPRKNDIGLDYTIVSRPLYLPHYPHINAFQRELSRWRFYYLEPDIMREENELKEVRNLGSFGDSLSAFYNTLITHYEERFNSFNKSLKTIIPAVDEIRIERNPKSGRLLLMVREGEGWFSARVVSEGTLRILALLGITNPIEPTSVVGYEEPENGVHPRRLKLIADLFQNAARRSDSQFLINSHSTLFPDFFEPSQIIVCEKSDYATSFRKFDKSQIFKQSNIEKTLEEPSIKQSNIEKALEKPSIGERIIRGDYGG